MMKNKLLKVFISILISFFILTSASCHLWGDIEGMRDIAWPVILLEESFSINVVNLDDFDQEFIGPTLKIASSQEETTKTITVANPSSYDAGSIQWFYEGYRIWNTSGMYGETLILHSNDYGRIGTHFITAAASKDGKIYSKTISFNIVL